MALGMAVGIGVGVLVVFLVNPRLGSDLAEASRSTSQPLWLVAVALAVAGLLAADAASLVVLLRALCARDLCPRVPTGPAVGVALESHLVGGATSFGGLEIPYQIVLLRGLGLNVSQASSVVIVKGLVHTSVLAVVALSAFLPFVASPLTRLQRWVVLGVVLALAVVWLFGYFWLRRPLGLGVLPGRARRMVGEFREAVAVLRQAGWRVGAWVVGLQLVYWLCMFSLIPLILQALGWRGPLATVVTGQAALQVLMPFSPLPGGAGIAELGYLALVGPNLPADLRVASLVLWRIATWVLPMAVGALALGYRTARVGRRRLPQVRM